MKTLTVRVDAKKYASVLEALNNLGAEIVEKKGPKKPRKSLSTEEKLTPSQRKLWTDIKQGLHEVKLAEEGKLKLKTFDEFMEELRAEGLAE